MEEGCFDSGGGEKYQTSEKKEVGGEWTAKTRILIPRVK